MYSINPGIFEQHFPKHKDFYFCNFEPKHLDYFEELKDYGISYLPSQNRKHYIIEQSKSGPCIVAVLHNEPVAIFGAVILWKGVAEGWSVISDKARRYRIAMCKSAFAFFDIIHILYDLHRLQITVKTEDERAVAWATYLGFEPEGLMKAYSSDKEDTYIMGITYG